MSKNLTMIEINEFELDKLHSDLDYAGNELFIQEGKIRELVELNEKYTDKIFELEQKLEVTIEALEKYDQTPADADINDIAMEALAKIKR